MEKCIVWSNQLVNNIPSVKAMNMKQLRYLEQQIDVIKKYKELKRKGPKSSCPVGRRTKGKDVCK